MNGICIQMLPAGSGDCIYIEFPDANFRMLIDGGYVKTYQDFLKDFLLKLKNDGKRLNLIVVTHVDDDHINGIKALLEENGTSENPNIIGIDEIWFNGLAQCMTGRESEQEMDLQVKNLLTSMIPAKLTINKECRQENISYTKGSDLTALIKSGEYAWNVTVENKIVNENQVVIFGDIKISILNPNFDTLIKMGLKWKRALQNRIRSIQITENTLYDAAFEGYFLKQEIDVDVYRKNISYSEQETNWIEKYSKCEKKEVVDSKLTNCSSIALLIQYKRLNLLFPGDCPIQYLEQKLPDQIDVIKLPHHGSEKNISREFIKKKKVNYYLLSTDGKKHNHPGKTVIANIIKNADETTALIKNYEIDWLKGVGAVDEL